MKLAVQVLMVCVVCSSSVLAQAPERPNRLTADGERVGEWILWLDRAMDNRELEKEGELFRRNYKPSYYALVTFVDGHPTDSVTIYYETGELRWKGLMVTFHPFTPVDGQYELLHKNGVRAAVFQFVNGRREGIEQWWYDSEAREWEKPYNNGKLNGVATQWYRNGKVRSKIPYINGVIHGIVMNWYESGVRESEIPYVHGKIEGMRIDYRKTGEKRSETPLVADKVHGIVIEYYKSGVMSVAESYENNRPNGTTYGYYESGARKFECNYLDGELHGYSKGWTEEGWLKPLRLFDHGRLVK